MFSFRISTKTFDPNTSDDININTFNANTSIHINTKTFDPIRDVFARTKEAKLRGFNKGRFSFNVKGGRCEHCHGDGEVKIEMFFLPDVYISCEKCKGNRYNRETLEISYKGKNIAEVLDIHPVMLYRWKKEYREGDIMSKADKGSLDSETSRELKRLKRIEKAHKVLQMEHEVLKKSIQYCSDRKKNSSNI